MAEGSEFLARWSAFLEFMRPKLIAAGDAKAQAARLRQLADLRVDQVAAKRPNLMPLEISVIVQPDKAKPKFAIVAAECRVMTAEEAKAPLPHNSPEAGRFIESAILLEVFPPEELKAALREFKVRWERKKADATAAPPPPPPSSEKPLPEKVAALLGNVKELWSIPALTQKLQQMLTNPETPIEDISSDIEKDPGLSTQVLRVVNSAFYAAAEKVKSIERAVAMLGFMTVKRIVTIASMISQFGKEDPQVQFDLKAYWGHSLWVACAASNLAKAVKAGVPDEFFGAGLLHDLGKLVEYQYLKPQMKLILAAMRGGSPFETAEDRVLGVRHSVIGACVCEKWGFPQEVVAAVRHHLDTPVELDGRPLPRMATFVTGMCQVSKKPESAERWAGLMKVTTAQVGDAAEAAKKESLASLREIFLYA